MDAKLTSKKPAKAPTKQSSKELAEVSFTAGRIRSQVKRVVAQKAVTAKASIYLAGAITFIMEEILDLARQNQKASGAEKSRLTPRHIMLAFECDQELKNLLGRDRILRAGVPERICAALTTKAKKKKPPKKRKSDDELLVEEAAPAALTAAPAAATPSQMETADPQPKKKKKKPSSGKVVTSKKVEKEKKPKKQKTLLGAEAD